MATTAPSSQRKVLLLHGSRQTGQLLLGRISKLRKKLEKELNLQLVAPDAPFVFEDDAADRHASDQDGAPQLRQWWNRQDNVYVGLDETLEQLQTLWNNDNFAGIVGFSQGARLAHIMALSHARDGRLDGLAFVILVAGYDAPLPDNLGVPSGLDAATIGIPIPSLHVWGDADKLITPKQSRALSEHYRNPQVHTHHGGHHVPMRAANVTTYLQFIQQYASADVTTASPSSHAAVETTPRIPDDETAQAQTEEVEALTAIFSDEVRLLSKRDSNGALEHPIQYAIDVPASDEGIWPPHPIALHVSYPYDYPPSLPSIQLKHDNNVMEFSTSQSTACLQTIRNAAKEEEGMPCVLACLHAAREYFESGAMMETATDKDLQETQEDDHLVDFGIEEETDTATLPAASQERIRECNLQGLQIAEAVLRETGTFLASDETTRPAESPTTAPLGKGGSWNYTIGLVGKPSAGKSTFFNAATAFARQRNDSENVLGGATMAPHPFTTIDPNIGVCLVPAPEGSCPEESYKGGSLDIGSTHGRDNQGRRLLPVLLKDVAGLVPGAYQGRGRGNKFLNDLTDADVLVHVLDGSGTADSEGNPVVSPADADASEEANAETASHPLQDIAWIRNELIEWVYTNLLYKWDTIRRKGRSKLSDMFSGYGQTQAVTWSVLSAVEMYLASEEQRDHALDHLDTWDAGDVHRLVSAFLGVRFPMASAINKFDLPTSRRNVSDILAALPLHGAHVGIPLSARREMNFLRHILEEKPGSAGAAESAGAPPTGVWNCLQSAMSLREPVLVFPVHDFVQYAPLPGLARYTTEDPSLPNARMIACLDRSGGTAPTAWDITKQSYATADQVKTSRASSLCHTLLMKPGSTVEDVYLVLKKMGALSGEFVRAEGCVDVQAGDASNAGAAPKPVPKHRVVTKSIRILKIMTNKRTAWQNK